VPLGELDHFIPGVIAIDASPDDERRTRLTLAKLTSGSYDLKSVQNSKRR